MPITREILGRFFIGNSLYYYVFSSTLLASCSVPLLLSKLRAASPRVAMTERYELAALVILQRWVNLGDL